MKTFWKRRDGKKISSKNIEVLREILENQFDRAYVSNSNNGNYGLKLTVVLQMGGPCHDYCEFELLNEQDGLVVKRPPQLSHLQQELEKLLLESGYSTG